MWIRDLRKGLFLIVAVGVFLLAGVTPSEGKQQVPFITTSCSVADFGAANPTGLGYNSSTGLLVVTDSSDDVAYLYDRDCNLDSSFSTSAIGSSYPEGITHNPVASMYAIVDSSADEVFFTNESGAYIGQCDTAAIGATSPTGIAYNSATGNYAITDDGSNDEVYIIDDSVMNGGTCNLISQFDTLAFGSDRPYDIAYLPDTDEYAIADYSDQEVYIVDTAGNLQTQFDTYYGLGYSYPYGITYVASLERYYIMDNYDLSYEVDARGTSEFFCDTGGEGATSPSDVTFNPNTNRIVFVDSDADTVFILRPDCTLVRQFGTLPFGADNPTGIAYIPGTNQVAIADATDDEIYFVGYDSETLESQCDTLGLGITSPSGIDYISQMDMLVVTDSSDNALFLMDRLTCKLVNQNDLGSLEFSTSGTTSTGAGFHVGVGTFLVTDASTDDVYIANFEGIRERRFDTYGLGLTSITGITPIPGGERFLVSDSGLDDIYLLTLPLLKEPLSLSGQFTSSGLGGTMLIFERGGGPFTGTFKSGSITAPIFGYYEADTGDISLGAIHPNGTPLVWSGTVSEDLNTITLPGSPLGTLTRIY